MKKRIIALGMCVIMAFSMTACGKGDKKSASSGNVKKKGTVSTAVADMGGTKYKSKVTLPDYKNITLAESLAEVTDENVNVIDYNLLAAQVANTDNAVRNQGTVKKYDVVDIDFVGKISGVEFEGGSSQGYILGIGSGSFIDGFEDGLIGVSVGSTVDLSLTFPETYQNEELAGKPVIFTVTVNGILEINDAFIKDNTDVIQYFLYRYFSKAERVSNADEYYRIVKDGLRVQKVVGNTFQKIRDESLVEYDETELNNYISEQKKPYVEAAQENEMDLMELLSYYGYTDFETEADFDNYWREVYGNMCVMMALANAEKLKVTDSEYEDVANAMVYISSGKYADVAAYEVDYEKQDTVDDILYGKVYYKVADYIKVVPDAEAQIKPEAETESTAQ